MNESNTGTSWNVDSEGYPLHPTSPRQPAEARNSHGLPERDHVEPRRAGRRGGGDLTIRVIAMHPPITHVLMLEEETGRMYWLEVEHY